MIRFIILSFMLYVGLVTNIYSQIRKISDIITNEDIALTEKKIMKQFKKTKCYDKHGIYTISSFIFVLHSAKPRYMQDFLNGSFIDDLEVSYIERKKNYRPQKEQLYLIFPSYIYNHDGHLVGMSDGRLTGCISKTGYIAPHQEAINYLNNPNLTYFLLQGASVSLLFAADDENNIYIINTNRKPFELCPLQTYILKYWDEGLLQ